MHVDGKRLLHTEDHRFTGSVGLLAQGGTVTFGPPSVSAVTTNLTGWTTSGGTWTATPLGWRADPSQGTTTRAVTTTQAYDTGPCRPTCSCTTPPRSPNCWCVPTRRPPAATASK